MEKLEKRKSEEYTKDNMKKFTIYEPYTMEEESAFARVDPIAEDIKGEDQGEEQD